jgi:hypothetical protein
MRLLVATASAAATLASITSTFGAEPSPRQDLAYVFAYPAPPTGFKPLTASDAELAKYGLPARPNPFGKNPALYATWSHAMAAARFRVEPQIRITDRRHVPAVALAREKSLKAGALTSTNWAGQTILNGSTFFGSGSYTKVLAQWVVSAVQQAIGTCTSVDVSATWIGIDGTGGSSDVLQAGTEADAYCRNGVMSTNYYPWFEWYPANEYQITNFAVYPGAPVFAVLQATSSTTGTATFVNLQSNQYVTVGLAAPVGTTLKGNSAEWIVERPSTGTKNVAGTLADYGMIWISSEVAYLASEVNTANYDVPGDTGAGRTAYTLTMVDNNGQTLASPYPQGPSAEDLNVSGSAY